MNHVSIPQCREYVKVYADGKFLVLVMRHVMNRATLIFVKDNESCFEKVIDFRFYAELAKKLYLILNLIFVKNAMGIIYKRKW